MRRTAVTAVFLSLGLALTACGSRVDPAGTGGSAPAAASCVDTSGSSVKIGFLNSRSGTMAISENTVYNSLKMATDEINAAGGVLGKQLDRRRRGRRLGADRVRREGPEADPQRLRRRGVRRLDLVVAQGDAAGLRGQQRAAVLPGPVRGPGVVAEHLLHGRDDQPADRARRWTTSRRRAPRASSWSAATTSSRGPPTRSSRRRRRRTAWRSRARSTPRWATPTSPPSSPRSRAPDADAVFNTLNGDSNVAFFKEYKNAGLTADAHAGRLSVSIAEEEVGGIGIDNIVGQPVAWNYYQTIDSPGEQEVRRGFKTKSTAANKRHVATRWRPPTPRSTSGRAWSRRPTRSTVPDVQAAAGGVTLRRARGHGHGQRRQPPHRQDRAASARSAQDGLIYTDWSSGKPIEPDPYLEDLRLGRSRPVPRRADSRTGAVRPASRHVRRPARRASRTGGVAWESWSPRCSTG